MRLVLLLLAWLAAMAPAAAHQITFSHLTIHLDRGGTAIALQIPVQALLQQQPALRPDRADLRRLLQSQLRVADDGRPLDLDTARWTKAGADVVATVAAPPLAGRLTVDANLFPDDPLHKLFVDIYRGPDLAGQYVLDRQDGHLELAAPTQSSAAVIATFVREGVRHIFIGPDHILFVIGLILLGGRIAAQAKIVTAFTLAHSVTLALATLGVVHLPPRLVESLIALSIVFVGVHDLRRLWGDAVPAGGRDPRIAMAGLFGLVHGFGFASVLGALRLPSGALAVALGAFNVGVELGQVAILLLAAPLLLLLRRCAPPPAARGILLAVAAAVTVAGGVWFGQRAFG